MGAVGVERELLHEAASVLEEAAEIGDVLTPLLRCPRIAKSRPELFGGLGLFPGFGRHGGGV